MNNESPPQSAYPTSPMAQTPPSNNVSPTNHTHLHVKQLRQPRQPLYMPAALRPTELPTRPKDVPGQPKAPDTPPDSKHGSFDSARSSASSSSSGSRSNTVTFSANDEIDRLRMSLSRAASEDLEESSSAVSGNPTTAHWKPDLSRLDCAVCHVSFTWYFRRHHCRKCGEVVCGNHLTRTVPLDQNARFHSQGMVSRACDPCVDEWKIVKKLRHSRANSLADSMTSSNGTDATAGTTKPAVPIPRYVKQDADVRVGSLARSEGGMVWSTF
ncbi:hypothetical protein K431DRAFT_236234 [Polychaeton citri CBS 116435]|uniref:FYVE-type domain-containing protein n=1 Tax=Polychaeton citri CBS 116435 TaxID=1314669 RepID=A0A9P4PW58_9PEZI|nr:hypothetical protein K431DRAFT_236234 [Polychaeton citri CBS 116435]